MLKAGKQSSLHRGMPGLLPDLRIAMGFHKYDQLGMLGG